jgi:iron complex transport system ATP-binding protein
MSERFVLSASELELAYGDRTVIDDLTVHIPTGALSVIVGPNACGKSTLLRALARLLEPRRGTVLLDGESIRSLPTREVARRLGILPQAPIAPEGITVADLVARGRAPHQGWLRQWTRADEEAVATALVAASVDDLAHRPVDELSGGQRQRVWIAMTLAQDTATLLLDEPTTFLDLAHQIDVLDLLADLNRERGRTVVAVLHDLNQACRFAHHVIAMRDGEIIAQGTPADVVTEALVARVFGLSCRVVPDPVTATPMVVPISRHGSAGASS